MADLTTRTGSASGAAEGGTAPEAALRSAALIGVGVHGLPWKSRFSALKGPDALAELDKDLSALGRGNPSGRRSKAFKSITRAYRKAAEILLSLDAEAVLANSREHGYDASHREGGFADGFDFSMSHHVLLPYRPGGFIRVVLDVHGPLNDLSFGVDPYIDHHGDKAGREADQSYNDERNAMNTRLVFEFVMPRSREAANA